MCLPNVTHQIVHQTTWSSKLFGSKRQKGIDKLMISSRNIWGCPSSSFHLLFGAAFFIAPTAVSYLSLHPCTMECSYVTLLHTNRRYLDHAPFTAGELSKLENKVYIIVWPAFFALNRFMIGGQHSWILVSTFFRSQKKYSEYSNYWMKNRSL